MDNEKLLKERNEKLAKFAGFKSIKRNIDGIKFIDITRKGKRFDSIPDFEKVDNCIKWLLPKLKELDDVTFFPATKGYWWSMSVIDIPFEGDTLAEAIEKYVDWEKESK